MGETFRRTPLPKSSKHRRKRACEVTSVDYCEKSMDPSIGK
jgi:hypothetical protein